ncbi:hypothetical protein CAEBREN_22619 [Caenorhabditis brenneri]|uniref:Uncharacterized protein n=1 Tax=Caenorhabditis brenneri TaxID=135651 RepID=G0MMG2_CAEBE|nr:hypothetical protein CAEBREN_22619 [Caenorhabditis brenneri]
MDPYNSRPMSYDSLKILLQYAKPNLRFELSRRIPSIRLTEKTVPLRIDKLLIGSHGVEVDDIKYEARVKRYYSSDDTDLRDYDFNYTSQDGDWDLNEWGFDDYSSETVFTPGDLVFQRERQMPRQAGRSEEQKKAIENELKFVEWMVAKKLGIEKRVMKTMSRFQAVVDGAAFGVNTKRSVKIPLNNGSQISISYGRQVYRSWTRLRLMTIEVVAT